MAPSSSDRMAACSPIVMRKRWAYDNANRLRRFTMHRRPAPEVYDAIGRPIRHPWHVLRWLNLVLLSWIVLTYAALAMVVPASVVVHAAFVIIILFAVIFHLVMRANAFRIESTLQ